MTIYLVQAFVSGPSGRIRYLPAKEMPSAVVATQRARVLGEAGGAVAVSRCRDPGTGEYGEPVVLARFGVVPREFA